LKQVSFGTPFDSLTSSHSPPASVRASIAEAQKEQKRKEYVQKQKQKLAQYQSKVKSEAEKIQVLQSNNARASWLLFRSPVSYWLLLCDVMCDSYLQELKNLGIDPSSLF
jgi:hypothetical protein